MSVGSAIKQLAGGVYLSEKSLPDAPDMRYEPAQAKPGFILSTVQKITDQIKRGNPLPGDTLSVGAIVDALKNEITKSGEDDRKRLFTVVIDSLAKVDPNSPITHELNDLAISKLFDAIPHPPATFITHRFRSADGSGNNILQPDIGKAGTPYARSVPSKSVLPIHELPDEGLVFDLLLKRRYPTKDSRENWTTENNHKNGNSSLTFAWASIVTHSLFKTRRPINSTDTESPMYNDTSSYLDLSPLYGSTLEEQRKIRLFDGRGKLYPDSFSEDRLSHLPDAVSAILVIFNRNHNFIADMLLKINEKGNWKDPATFASKVANDIQFTSPELSVQDEEIFQTARLINCGHFISIVFNDYVAGFLGQTKHAQSWHLKPFDMIRREDGQSVSRGEGNQCSVEFNLLYRWHSTISLKDEEWTEKKFEAVLGTRNWDQIPLGVFLQKAAPLLEIEQDPTKRTFGGMTRGPDGKFDDTQLAAIIQDASKTPAQRYGARGCPGVLRHVEILGMMQARQWSVCSMNDFRRFLGLKPFDSFKEWNSDPEIWMAAQSLYKHIDRLEFYPGIMAEENLPESYGSRFGCGYTLMRAILCDAISLVRGDRFYTTEFTPANLTSWGFQDCQYDPDNGAFGAALPKLLLRHLPNNYDYNSVVGLFPFFTREAMKENLDGLKLSDQYNFNDPKPVQQPVVVETLKGIKDVFNDNKRFKVTYTDNMKYLTQDYGFFLVFDDDAKHGSDRTFTLNALRILHSDPAALNEFAQFYKTTTIKLLNEHSFKYDSTPGSPYGGRYVDIVRNVINLTSVRWAADYLTGLSLKTKENPHGLVDEQFAYDMFMILFMCVFENVAPEHGWILKSKAKQAADFINGVIESSLREVMPGFSVLNSISSGFSWLLGTSIEQKPCHQFLSRLAENAEGRDIKALTACVIGLAVGSSVNYAQQCAQIVDFYLDDARAEQRAEICRLVHREDATSTRLLVGYIKEAQRLAPQFPGLYRQLDPNLEKPVVINQGNGKPNVTVNPGQLVWGSYYNAQTDPRDFPDPLVVKPDRPLDKYAVQGIGFHGCPGVAYAEKTLVEVIRVIFSLKNLRRAQGPAGTLASFAQDQAGTKAKLYLDDSGNISAWPGCLMVAWDE